MKLNGKRKYNTEKSKNLILKELDKGIASMENGRTVPHDKAMQMIREKLKDQC